MEKILIYIIVFLGCYVILKNTRTFTVRRIISDAILNYRREHGQSSYINTDKMEPYDETLYRLWDWGYKRIVPKDVFDKIKDYIK